FKIMKETGTHEDCLLQMYRLFHDYLYATHPASRDQEGYIRIDDLELQASVQQKIATLWPLITSENVHTVTDLEGYCDDFYRLFGFNIKDVDYAAEVDFDRTIDSLSG
ncbi:MAG: hypothetical protein ACD_45C00341G0001, partial [uncultured bacterium]